MDPIKYYDLSYQVYEKIKNMILNDELKPGDKIKQESIAAQLGVSRTPLHKAFQMLENEYLVESIPRRGIFVRKIDLAQVCDVFECREGLEAIAARRVARTHTKEDLVLLKSYFAPFVGLASEKINLQLYQIADREFHNTMLQLSGNKIIMNLDILGNILVRSYMKGLIREPDVTLSEHLAILDAIEKRNELLAEKLVKEHLQKSYEELRRTIETKKS